MFYGGTSFDWRKALTAPLVDTEPTLHSGYSTLRLTADDGGNPFEQIVREGRAHVEAHVATAETNCIGFETSLVLAAFADGVQINLPGFGSYVRTDLEESTSAVVSFELEGLPTTPGLHTLTIIKYFGDGRYTQGLHYEIVDSGWTGGIQTFAPYVYTVAS